MFSSNVLPPSGFMYPVHRCQTELDVFLFRQCTRLYINNLFEAKRLIKYLICLFSFLVWLTSKIRTSYKLCFEALFTRVNTFFAKLIIFYFSFIILIKCCFIILLHNIPLYLGFSKNNLLLSLKSSLDLNLYVGRSNVL